MRSRRRRRQLHLRQLRLPGFDLPSWINLSRTEALRSEHSIDDTLTP